MVGSPFGETHVAEAEKAPLEKVSVERFPVGKAQSRTLQSRTFLLKQGYVNKPPAINLNSLL